MNDLDKGRSGVLASEINKPGVERAWASLPALTLAYMNGLSDSNKRLAASGLDYFAPCWVMNYLECGSLPCIAYN